MKRLFFDRMVPIVEKLKDIALKLRPDLPINSQPRTVNDGLTLIEKAVDGLGSGSGSESGSSGGSGQSGSGCSDCPVRMLKISGDNIPESFADKVDTTDPNSFSQLVNNFKESSYLATRENALTVEEFAYVVGLTEDTVHDIFAGKVTSVAVYGSTSGSFPGYDNYVHISDVNVVTFATSTDGFFSTVRLRTTFYNASDGSVIGEPSLAEYWTDREYVATHLTNDGGMA